MQRALFIFFSIILSLSIFTPLISASDNPTEEYEYIFNLLEQIRNRQDDYKEILENEFLAEWNRGLLYNEQDKQGREDVVVPTVLRYIDLPELQRSQFEYSIAFIDTSTVTKTIHPVNWSNTLEVYEIKVVPEQIVKLSRGKIWLDTMSDIVWKLNWDYPNEINILSKDFTEDFEKYKSEIPFYMKTLEKIINYTNWILEKPEDYVKSHYGEVEGYPYDWFQHGIYRDMNDDAQALYALLEQDLPDMGAGEWVDGGVGVPYTADTQGDNNGNEIQLSLWQKIVTFLGTFAGFFGVITGRTYTIYTGREVNPIWHLRRAYLRSRGLAERAILFTEEGKEVLRRIMEKTGATPDQMKKGILYYFKNIVPAIKAMPVISYLNNMAFTIDKPNKTEADIRYMGESTLGTAISTIAMVGGAYLGGQIGTEVGLLIGSPTGYGALMTGAGGAFVGALGGSMVGEFAGNWVSSKVADVGGDVAVNLYNYSKANDNLITKFLNHTIFK